MKIVDLRCAVIGRHPIVRIVTDENIYGLGEVEYTKTYLKPWVLHFKEALLGEDPTDVERVMMKIRQRGSFKPYGAAEVRRAAQAFITMRERIERHVHQRTDMLAGISHDLKTPLTRIKLQLALMDENADVAALREDIVDMEHMLDEYLQFERGEGGEAAVATDIRLLLRDAADAARRAEGADADSVVLDDGERVVLTVKRNALKRCVTNLIDNALKYGQHARIALERNPKFVEMNVDDDGPGIPEARREEAFRPFHRLDEGRNLQIGGVGLGLAIARDIARAHGGDLVLSDSPLGGLRATLRLPV